MFLKDGGGENLRSMASKLTERIPNLSVLVRVCPLLHPNPRKADLVTVRRDNIVGGSRHRRCRHLVVYVCGPPWVWLVSYLLPRPQPCAQTYLS